MAVPIVMTKEEREAFLADVHTAVISIPEEGRGPVTV
ncbi:MAG: pyridoxamine 5'-phosphate oxidase family protein, partial [Actinobacteria bacterium]|nr:pyridoxamine 5'-phosphate oxidase family protein [Actinomycetota bacterium]NIS32045.1 pyridoxamine 5'-phosphate oxidase family protein [Actinomycetota bacterium]NIT96025.1 pyridoxamine 5'-phosphate oxidase family protein [Actinomycetota bacterium]NIU19705.1 pyridoxamine 5'-phosphate oxidase family protein [Actinomycetota bacterium]NIU67111.1 pyridoxamine 5'-phosphate oxidase family protein [Actinomycetota bacterium]